MGGVSEIVKFHKLSNSLIHNFSFANNLQGVQGQIFMFQFALTDRNMQARFGLKVFWES